MRVVSRDDFRGKSIAARPRGVGAFEQPPLDPWLTFNMLR